MIDLRKFNSYPEGYDFVPVGHFESPFGRKHLEYFHFRDISPTLLTQCILAATEPGNDLYCYHAFHNPDRNPDKFRRLAMTAIRRRYFSPRIQWEHESGLRLRIECTTGRGLNTHWVFPHVLEDFPWLNNVHYPESSVFSARVLTCF